MKVRKYVAKILIYWTLHQTLTISEQECPECSGPIVGRNFLVESIAAVVFSRELSMSNRYTDNDEPENDGNDNLTTMDMMLMMFVMEEHRCCLILL